MSPLIKVAFCVVVTMISGCDLAMTDSGSTNSASTSDKLNERVAELSEQNAELIQMLEEAEGKIAQTTNELEAAKKELENQRAQLDSLGAQRDDAHDRLDKAANVMGALRAKFQSFTSETAKQLESWDALFPNMGQLDSRQPDSEEPSAPQSPAADNEKSGD